MAAARAALDEADDLESRADGVPGRQRRLGPEPPGGARGRHRRRGPVRLCSTRSAELHAATGGAFDVTSTPLSRCWGFLTREGRVPTDAGDRRRARGRRHGARAARRGGARTCVSRATASR